MVSEKSRQVDLAHLSKCGACARNSLSLLGYFKAHFVFWCQFARIVYYVLGAKDAVILSRSASSVFACPPVAGANLLGYLQNRSAPSDPKNSE